MKQVMEVRPLPPESFGISLVWRKWQTRGVEIAVGVESPVGVRIPPPAWHAGVVQMADTPSSEGGSCEFESHLPYPFREARA